MAFVRTYVPGGRINVLLVTGCVASAGCVACGKVYDGCLTR